MSCVCFIIQSTIVGDWFYISTSMEADIYPVACEPEQQTCTMFALSQRVVMTTHLTIFSVG